MSISQITSLDIEQCFYDCFFEEYQTRLVGGADEPLYQPKNAELDVHTIFYRADYVSSALHEASHWCLASEEKLLLEDYGFWYIPESERTIEQQMRFMKVEAKPQALERLFSEQIGLKFRPSLDSFICSENVVKMFHESIENTYQKFLKEGLSGRSFKFFNALASL